MKKLLLSALLVSGLVTSAQVLQSENFNDLTLGDVGTDITGVTEGQGGWLTFASNGTAPTTSTNAANDNFIVVDSGFDGQGVQITGGNGSKGTRFMWKPGFTDIWATRDTGNEVLEVEFDLYTGAATGSTARYGIRLYGFDGTASRVLNGFVFNSGSKVLQGVCYIAPPAPNTPGAYLINLAAAPGLVLDTDTWYRIGFGYDSVTGAPFWKINGDAQASTVNEAWYVASPEFPIDEIDIISDIPTASATVPVNTETSSVIFDNILVEATAVESLLGVGQVAQNMDFSVYPNPATSVLNVNAPADVSISQIVLMDLNGRTVKTLKVEGVANAQLPIGELASGIYTMKVTSNVGTAVKKVVKQ